MRQPLARQKVVGRTPTRQISDTPEAWRTAVIDIWPVPYSYRGRDGFAWHLDVVSRPQVETAAAPSPPRIVAPAANTRPRVGNGQPASSPQQEVPKRKGQAPKAKSAADEKGRDDDLDDEIPSVDP